MGGIINFFKNLIGGIAGFFTGLLSSKKGKKSSEGFFMELEESEATPAAIAATAIAAVEKLAKPITANKAAANNKVAAKATKPAKQAKQAAVEPEPAPAANPLNLPQPTVSFAETNQLPLPTPRRRPGANMGSYLNMAKNMTR